MLADNWLELFINPFPNRVREARTTGAYWSSEYWLLVEFHKEVEIPEGVGFALFNIFSNAGDRFIPKCFAVCESPGVYLLEEVLTCLLCSLL